MPRQHKCCSHFGVVAVSPALAAAKAIACGVFADADISIRLEESGPRFYWLRLIDAVHYSALEHVVRGPAIR